MSRRPVGANHQEAGTLLCTRCHVERARHKVEHGGTDTGSRVCCGCMDEIMVLLAAHLFAEGKADEALTGLASFNRDHAARCGSVS